MIQMETEEQEEEMYEEMKANTKPSRNISTGETYCEMKSKSISSASMRSTKGKASIPLRPGWIPQSNIILRSEMIFYTI
jgi:hypothetical protein